MQEFLLNFHFLRPLWLLALLPAGALLLALVRRQGRASQWQNLIAKSLQPYLLQGAGGHGSRYPFYLLALGWALVCLALAGPVWHKQRQALTQNVSALVILWDLSPSMNATDLAPSRVERVRLKLIDLMHARREGLSALVAYAGESHVVTPLTDDSRTIINLTAGLNPQIMPFPGSNPEMALEQAQTLLRDAGVNKGNILFVTDGIARDAIDTLASKTRNSQHRISVWGVGTDAGAPIPLANGGFAKNARGEIVVAKLDHQQLSDAAVAMGGVYIPFSNDDFDIRSILSFGLRENLSATRQSEREFDQWQEQGPLLVLLLLPLIALGFRRGWVLCLLLGLMLPLEKTEAAEWQWRDLWQTADQQAQRQLQAGDAEGAAGRFNNKNWQAIANYRAGKYELAEQGFAEGDSARDAYNRGNALTRSGQYDQAIAAYNQALEQQANFAEAEHNKAIAQKLKALQQQQQQQQDGQQSADDGQQSQEQNQAGENSQQQQGESADQNQNGEQQQAGQQSDGDKADNSGQANDQQGDQGQAQEPNQQQQESLAQHYGEHEQSEGDDTQQASAPLAEQNESEPAQNPDEQSAQQLQLSQSPEQKEQNQALEQWLRKVPDDPSGLLRNKFLHEYRQRQREMRSGDLRHTPGEQTEERW